MRPAARVSAASAISVADADGSDPTILTDAGEDAQAYWSHDGKHLAYLSTAEGNPDVFVIDADSSG